MVVAAEKFRHLSNLAVAAAVDPGRWREFLDEFGQALGTRVCTQLMGYDQLTKAAPLTFSSGYDPEILRLYDSHYADKNPFAANFGKCAVGDVISTHQLCPPELLKQTPFYADLLEPSEDIIAGGGAMLANDADRMFLIGGNMRAKDRGKYEADWLKLCAELAPVIRQSLEINRTICGLTFEKWASEQMLLGTGTALLVVDPALRVHYACAEAHRLLARGAIVGNGFGHRLRFRSERLQAEVGAYIRSQSKCGGDVFRNWRFTDEDGRKWTCRTMALRLGDLEETPFGAFLELSISAVLVALKPDLDRLSFLTHVQSVLGLSPAEAAIALKLCEGQTPAEIAEERQGSIHTVRNQIKASLAKTGCRRQSDLVRKVEQLRLQGVWLD
ncbi:MAG: helix-turn-helix transcriptional regulator [Roseibium sp.]